MNSNKDIQFLSSLSNIAKNLDDGKKLINSDLIMEFQSKVENLRENLEEVKNKERVLRIGIVGEVKAGKSSFLNALIFDGESVLPKAPTPMTAALTKLGYRDEPYAKVVFYTDYEWESIKALSREYDKKIKDLLEKEHENARSNKQVCRATFESIELKYKNQIPTQCVACKELTRMVDKNGVDLGEYLSKTKEILGKSSYNEYMKELGNYVGSEGKLTPIVKHVEVFINNPMLKDIEVVDTPGLNDPIQSRSEKTKEFLLKCDVVFVLSYVGQFLGNEDIEFLTRTLPNEGIQKAILIGSKFDSGILDYKGRNATFKEACYGSKKNFDLQASSNVEDLKTAGNCSPIVSEIAKALPPKYISALLYSVAKKLQKKEKLSEEENHIIVQMGKRFSGFKADPEFLIDLSNILNIKNEVFSTLKEKKEEIIVKRIQGLTSSQVGKFIASLEDINITAKNNLSNLNKYDSDQTQEKLDVSKLKLDSIRVEVKNIFDMSNIEAKKILHEIVNNIEAQVDNYSDVSIARRTESHREIEKTGLFGLNKQVYNVTETINSANVSEVIANLRKYATRSKDVVNKEFETLFDINKLKKNIKKAVIGAFDLTDRNFNENDIIIPLEVVLKKLVLPKINIELEHYDEIIFREFSSGVVEGNQISKLMLVQERTLQLMAKDISQRIIEKGDLIDEMLNKQSGVFVDDIEKELKNNIERLQDLIEDKENNILEYEKFINNIANNKNKIAEFKRS